LSLSSIFLLLLLLLSLPLSFRLPFPSPALVVGPPKVQLGDLGKCRELPSGVWGGAPAEIELGAF